MQTVLLLALVAAAAANPLKFPGSVAELSSRCSQHTVCIGNRVVSFAKLYCHCHLCYLDIITYRASK